MDQARRSHHQVTPQNAEADRGWSRSRLDRARHHEHSHAGVWRFGLPELPGYRLPRHRLPAVRWRGLPERQLLRGPGLLYLPGHGRELHLRAERVLLLRSHVQLLVGLRTVPALPREHGLRLQWGLRGLLWHELSQARVARPGRSHVALGQALIRSHPFAVRGLRLWTRTGADSLT